MSRAAPSVVTHVLRWEKEIGKHRCFFCERWNAVLFRGTIIHWYSYVHKRGNKLEKVNQIRLKHYIFCRSKLWEKHDPERIGLCRKEPDWTERKYT